MMNANSMRIAIAAPVALLIAGCSGGGGGGMSYDGYEDRYNNLLGSHDATTYTDPSTLPHSGDGQYHGIMRMSADGSDIMGSMQLNFRFGGSGDPVSGSMGNFRDSLNTPLAGRFTIADGTINRGANPYVSSTYRAALTGSIMLPPNGAADAAAGDPMLTEYVLRDASLRGNFIEHGDAVGGRFDGGIYAPSTGAEYGFSGSYIAER